MARALKAKMASRLEDHTLTENFRHEALFYSGDEEFMAHSTRFIQAGLMASEPVLVAVIPRKIELLKDALGSDADEVLFVDMAATGRNPARIIPVWHGFIQARPESARRVRGIGEPIWAGRTGEEIVEVQRHESLINLAFSEACGWILCPYDTSQLGEDVLEEAYRTHPHIAAGNSRETSRTYQSVKDIRPALDSPLPSPRGEVQTMEVGTGSLAGARRFVEARARAFGFSDEKVEDLKLTVSELVANTLVHGGGAGRLMLWEEGRDLVLEVSDAGEFNQPLVGRKTPTVTQEGGRGMWMVNQLCDLVQMRTHPGGSIIRVRMTSL